MNFTNQTNLYKLFLAASAIIGLAAGFFLCFALTPNCKTRDELCALDIQLNNSLKTQLSKSEVKCSELLTESVKKALQKQQDSHQAKFKRLEESCNDLDCLQCRK